jgi:hypothetical protein
MPPDSYYGYLNGPNATWSDGFGRWVRTLKVAAIAGTLGAAAGMVGAIAIVRPHPEPTHPRIVGDVAQTLVRPPSRVESGVPSAPLATAAPLAAPSHLPAKFAVQLSPPSPPGWPLLPGARPHMVEAYAPASNGLYDRAKSAARAPEFAADAAETAGGSTPSRPVASARGWQRGKRLNKAQMAALQPTAVPSAARSPTLIVPPRVLARGARHKRSPDGSGYWRFARSSSNGDYDRDDWRDRDNQGGDSPDWGGGFLGLFGGDWRD